MIPSLSALAAAGRRLHDAPQKIRRFAGDDRGCSCGANIDAWHDDESNSATVITASR